jgi:hypothetical protein
MAQVTLKVTTTNKKKGVVQMVEKTVERDESKEKDNGAKELKRINGAKMHRMFDDIKSENAKHDDIKTRFGSYTDKNGKDVQFIEVKHKLNEPAKDRDGNEILYKSGKKKGQPIMGTRLNFAIINKDDELNIPKIADLISDGNKRNSDSVKTNEYYEKLGKDQREVLGELNNIIKKDGFGANWSKLPATEANKAKYKNDYVHLLNVFDKTIKGKNIVMVIPFGGNEFKQENLKKATTQMAKMFAAGDKKFFKKRQDEQPAIEAEDK